ncbi:MAG: T9SS type A sorting domain-containing protein [Bacteroidetes bacterium]|nr:T9SS type A sorting domain-containing protein [Bacteroidota bacterium]
MKKLFLIIVLLAFSSSFIFAQNLDIRPSKSNPNKSGSFLNLSQYLQKNVTSNTKATLVSEGFEGTAFPPTGWTKQSGNTNALYQWKVGTYPHSGAKDAFIEYDPAPAAQNEWLISPSYNLTTLTNPCIKFWWNMSYYWSVSPNNNYDFRVKVSTNGGTTWTTIFTEDSAGVFTSFTWYQKLIMLNAYSTSTNFKVAFQYQGTDGASLDVDDIFIGDMPLNNLTADRITLHDGYTKVPTGLGMPMYYDADISNFGVNTQTHVKLHAVVIGTGIDSTSIDTTISPNTGITDWSINNYFYTPPTTQGIFKVSSYLSSDLLPRVSLDTFNINVVCNTCDYSRDNNTYTGSRWAGSTGTTADPFTAVNRFQVKQDRPAYGIKCAVGIGTKVGSKIKAVLYKYFAGSNSRTIVAQSNNYYITAADIPASAPMNNPPLISLAFTSSYQIQTDSLYFAGIQVYGGTDTVTIATDDTGIPQWEQTSLYFDPTANTWYIWNYGNVDASIIRLSFDPSISVNEVRNSSINLFSCMPNPASSSTKISYELKTNDKVNIIITDIMGRVVRNINQGTQNKGNYNLDIDLNSLTSGTYFCTIKTSTDKATEKLFIVK